MESKLKTDLLVTDHRTVQSFLEIELSGHKNKIYLTRKRLFGRFLEDNNREALSVMGTAINFRPRQGKIIYSFSLKTPRQTIAALSESTCRLRYE